MVIQAAARDVSMLTLDSADYIGCNYAVTSHLWGFQPDAYFALAAPDKFHAANARYSLQTLFDDIFGEGCEFTHWPGAGYNHRDNGFRIRIKYGNDRLINRVRQKRHSLTDFVPYLLCFEVGIFLHIEFKDYL